MTQSRLQKRDLPKYQGDKDDEAKDDVDQSEDEKKAMTAEFSDKTNQLLDYIEKTYLKVKYLYLTFSSCIAVSRTWNLMLMEISCSRR